MAQEDEYWEGYRLNPDGTIQFTAIVNYAILAVRSGVIFQFNHARSQADMNEGRTESIQLHMSGDQVRGCANELLRIADQLGV